MTALTLRHACAHNVGRHSWLTASRQKVAIIPPCTRLWHPSLVQQPILALSSLSCSLSWPCQQAGLNRRCSALTPMQGVAHAE